MGQIPRSIEDISSLEYNIIVIIKYKYNITHQY